MSDFNYQKWHEQSMQEFWQNLAALMEREPDKYPPRQTVSIASKWTFVSLAFAFVFAFGACAYYSAVSARILSGILSIGLVAAGAFMMHWAYKHDQLVEKDIPKTMLWGAIGSAFVIFSSAAAGISFAGNVPVLRLIGVLCVTSIVIWGKWFIKTLVVYDF